MSADERQHRRRRLNEAERALWRGVIRSVVPLKRRRVDADPETEPAERSSKAAAHRPPSAASRRPAPAPASVPPLVALYVRLRRPRQPRA